MIARSGRPTATYGETPEKTQLLGQRPLVPTIAPMTIEAASLNMIGQPMVADQESVWRRRLGAASLHWTIIRR